MDSVIVENNCEDLECLEKYTWNFKESMVSIINRNNYNEYKIQVREIDTNNGNYLAKLYEVNIKGETEKGKEEINIFVKESIVLEKLNIIDIKDVYAKEIFAYKDLAKTANKLQDEAKIPKFDRFKFVSGYEESNNEIIILDNLSKRGFKTYYRMDVMPIEYAELAVKQLAKFHALSFVIENRIPEYFEKYIRTLKTPFNLGEDWNNFITNVCASTSKFLNENDREKIIHLEPIIKDKLNKYLTTCGSFKNCLTHGDYRMNNILVKEKNGLAVDVAIIDYQFINYGNPIRDFLFIIYTSTDRKFRQKHLEDLKNMYYDAMMNFLNYFNLDINKIYYTREEFEDAYKDCQDYGLMTAIYLSPLIFAPDDDKVDTSKLSLSEIGCNHIDFRYKERVQGLIDEFTECGYL